MNQNQHIAEQIARLQTRAQWFERIGADLPAGFDPVISNEADRMYSSDAPGAVLSFRRPYNSPEWPAAEILRGLESAGFQAMPATLCAYGQWRSSPRPFPLETVPETRDRGDTLKRADIIAPVWLELNQHTGAEFHTFMRAPSGLIFEIHIPAPAAYRVTPEWEKFPADRFGRDYAGVLRGARLAYPAGAYTLQTVDGAPYAEVSHLSRAFFGNDSGPHYSGRLFWNIYTEQSDFPAMLSAMVAALESAA